jgi:RHS repeat-associated protein
MTERTTMRPPHCHSLSRGKGGIGGLLARSSGYSSSTGNWSTHSYYFADGNANITYLESSSQTLTASYRYDPFGNTISSTGGPQDANVYRFSSKEILVNSGLYYYGYRLYDPTLQRWAKRSYSRADCPDTAEEVVCSSARRMEPIRLLPE